MATSILSFSSRSSHDRELPFPVYQALIESLYQGAKSNLGGIYANFALSAYLLFSRQPLSLKLCTLPLVVAGVLRLAYLATYLMSLKKGDYKMPDTVDKLERAERRHVGSSAFYALSIGMLCVYAIVQPMDETLRLVLLCDAIVVVMAGGGRSCGSPRGVLAIFACAMGPFSAACLMKGDLIHGLICVLLLFVGKVLRDSTRNMHGTLVNMLLTSRMNKESAANFNSALNNMGRGLALLDRGGSVKVANNLFQAVFDLPADPCGMKVEGLVARHIAPQVLLPDAYFEIMAFFRGKRGSDLDVRLAHDRVITMTYEPMHHGAVITVEDVTEKRENEQSVRRMARFDAVTGLPNRNAFSEHLDKSIAACRGGEVDGFSLLSIDLDRFKEVNDTHGHPVGDEILAAVAARLRQIVGPNGETSRFGGDEFMAVIDNCNPENVAKIAASLVRAIGQPYGHDGRRIVIGASVGVALFPQDADSREGLIRASDMALYDAKASGRGVAKFFIEDMAVAVRKRRLIGEALRDAVANGEFDVVYQPILDLVRMRTTAVEALVRWQNPTLGQVSPVDFIPVAEETGIIVDIGAYVLRRACSDAMNWPAHIRVAVNLSAVQFDRGDLIETVTSVLRETGLPPNRLELEITESILIGNSAEVIAKLSALRALDIHIALDDFGTGYSSLSYLNDFEFDKIKVDQSFVRDINNPNATKATSIIRAVNAIARDFQMAIVVEGVETEDQHVALRALGVSQAQGFLFSRPLPAHDIGVRLLREFCDEQKPLLKAVGAAT
jgi:diguanylate cyclase (GGDEF)-like protein